MHRSHTSSNRTRRHVFSALAIGVVLSMSPVFPGSGPVSAQAPATAVTGLSRGARGEAVRSVQQALVSQGIAVAGGVDGIFGAGTEAALKEFQSAHGLASSGEVDGATALELGLASSELLGLTQGVRSDAVKSLQSKLVAAGIAVSGGVDGIFGPGTTAAVKQFQSNRGFSPTGTVNAATAAALDDVSADAPAPAADPAPSEAPAASGDPLVGLKIGSRSDAVKTLQQTLMDAGFTVVGGADGIFGVLTANAVRSFQNANGLGQTGQVDDATAKVLATIIAPPASNQSDDHDPTITASPLLGLKYGSLGADVQALQQALISAGIRVRGGADGVFGLGTQTALKTYQATKGLEQSGRVDDPTANALASVGGATASATSPLLGLKYGALGNTVKQLQQALIDAGITVRGGADGIFGPATINAVKAFQTSQGIEATGKVGDATVAALANPQAAAPTTPAAAGGFAEYGEKGERVTALQAALVAAGISLRGGVDGDFGAGTSAAIVDFQRREGLSVTGKMNDETAAKLALAKAAEPTAPDPSSVQIAVFPVQGTCYYGDSWGYPRGGGRTHLGVDIIAPAGNLLYAAADGKVTKIYADYPGSLAGNGVRLTMADGTYFFYAHMTGIADGIALGVPVTAGQIIGTVGSTGNSGTPHLHFEVHPQGGAAVNPYPLVKAIDGCKITDPLPQ
jgi:peptidoglycan hydrolase-like protein with peptidoglycan-binding domain